MPEPVSPDIPKVPQATSEPQQQAPVVEKIPWWKKPFVRNKTPEPPQQDQSFNLEKVISRTTDGKVVVDKPELDKMIASVWKGPHEGEARFMESLRSNINTDASSPELKPINMGGFYTPSEQAAITSPGQAGKLYHEVIAAGENRQNVLPQHPDDQLVLDSQGQPVTEYIAQNDPRYTDPAIPDYLKIGTPDYTIRQAKGGNYLNDPDELNRALAAKRSALAANTFDSLTQAQQTEADSPHFKTVNMGEYRMRVAIENNLPMPEKGTVGFDAWKKLRNANTDLYKIKPKES